MNWLAGWYNDGSGRQRWWDGTQWTETVQLDTTAHSGPAVSGPVSTPTVGLEEGRSPESANSSGGAARTQKRKEQEATPASGVEGSQAVSGKWQAKHSVALAVILGLFVVQLLGAQKIFDAFDHVCSWYEPDPILNTKVFVELLGDKCVYLGTWELSQSTYTWIASPAMILVSLLLEVLRERYFRPD